MEQKLKSSLAGLMVTSRLFVNAVERVWEQLSCWEMEEDEAVDDIIAVEKSVTEAVDMFKDLPSKFQDIGEILRIAKEGVAKAKLMKAVEEIIEKLKGQAEEEEGEEEEDAALD